MCRREREPFRSHRVTAERLSACQTLRREDPLTDCELRFRKTRKSEARLRCDRLPNRAIKESRRRRWPGASAAALPWQARAPGRNRETCRTDTTHSSHRPDTSSRRSFPTLPGSPTLRRNAIVTHSSRVRAPPRTRRRRGLIAPFAHFSQISCAERGRGTCTLCGGPRPALHWRSLSGRRGGGGAQTQAHTARIWWPRVSHVHAGLLPVRHCPRRTEPVKLQRQELSRSETFSSSA